MKLFTSLATTGAAALIIATPAISQEYSPSEITAFVAAGAGGGTDNFARTIQPMLEERLGVNITVVNLPAASGAMAHQRTATAEPNGESIEFASSTYITSLAAGQNPIGLDQLTPVARMQSDVIALIVNPDKYSSFEEFREYAEANPGEAVIGGTHAASPDRMAFLSLADASGLDMNFIPYDEEGSVAANVLSGNIDGMFGEISSILGYMESGDMEPVLVFADERLEDFPDIPTTVENGWDLTAGNERGIFINAETDPSTIAGLEAVLKDIYESEEYQDYAEQVHLTYREGWLGSEEYREQLEQDLAYFTELLNEQNTGQ